jgi:hypothetical protein
MKNALSWKVLLSIGLCIAIVRTVTQGIIPDFLGLLEAIVIVLGLVDLVRSLLQKKSKSPQLTSFQQSDSTKKWYQPRKMDRREYGYTAIIGLLAGGVMRGVVGDVLALAGMICGIIWIYLMIRQRGSKQSPTASLKGGEQ